jgi:hypothetical protein
VVDGVEVVDGVKVLDGVRSGSRPLVFTDGQEAAEKG